MSQLYICNRANDKLCPSCIHNFPHEKMSITKPFSLDSDNCTQWVNCNDENGNIIFKVRCVKVK